MVDWTKGAIDTLEETMKKAGEAIYNLGEDALNTVAGQKVKAFVTGFVNEFGKACEALCNSVTNIVEKVKTDGLHVVLADGIRHFGKVGSYFITETLVNQVGGTITKMVTIPIADAMIALGLEEQGTAIRTWIDGAVKDVASHLDKMYEEHSDLLASLVEDPNEFVKRIEQEPWRIAELVAVVSPAHGMSMVNRRAFLTYGHQ